MKKTFRFFVSTMLTLFAFVLGSSNGVVMAAAADLPDAGRTNSGNSEQQTSTPPANNMANATDGIATETQGREDGDPEFYTKDIDKKITKIRPMATPIDQISRQAEAQHSDSFEVKYYSVGTRPIKCKVSEQLIQTSTPSAELKVDDPSMFTVDDTIRVVGKEGTTGPDGAYSGTNVPDLVLCVCGRSSAGNPLVYAVNGIDSGGQGPIFIPQLEVGQVLVRMGKACGELDAQTGKFNNLPTAEIQYCQNFMMQIEQSTFDKIAAKEVDWNFSDLEEDAIYDMRLTQENTYLFGARNKINHVTKDGQTQWFTGGIWYMAGKDIIVGSWNNVQRKHVITEDDLVEISKDLFVGTGIGNKRKIMFCGSEMLSALSKIKSEKFRVKESFEKWNLKFKSWETDFGEILTIHHELFDVNGMSDCAFAMDPEYLKKKTHVSWSRSILDLQKAGVRRTDAVVLQEVSCLYLTYAKAHARMKLAAQV